MGIRHGAEDVADSTAADDADFDAEEYDAAALVAVGDEDAWQMADAGARVFLAEANDGDGIVVAVAVGDGDCGDAAAAAAAEVPPAGRNNADAAGADADELLAIILALASWPHDQFAVRPERMRPW